jgi:hypothetical protein
VHIQNIPKCIFSRCSSFIATIAWFPIPGPRRCTTPCNSRQAFVLSQTVPGKSAGYVRTSNAIVPVAPNGIRGSHPGMENNETCAVLWRSWRMVDGQLSIYANIAMYINKSEYVTSKIFKKLAFLRLM